MADPAPAYLTFDDGPDPRASGHVLEALGRTHAPATFFVLGRRALQHPQLVKRILAEGHAVELHGFEHRSHETLSRAEIAEDARRGAGVLANLGVRPSRWRPPFGASAPTCRGR